MKEIVALLFIFSPALMNCSHRIDTIHGARRESRRWISDDGNTIAISNAVTNELMLSPGTRDVTVERKKRSSGITTLLTSDIQQVLAKHNDLRKNEGASDMRYMVWSNELADLAQQWADNCDFKHGHIGNHSTYGTDLGQNLFMTTAASVDDLDAAIMAWFNEKNYYTFSTTGCTGVCGHYTQVVWSSSYELGCGVRTCQPLNDTEDPNNVKSWPTGTLLVCDYGPRGNYAGAQPYTKGTACTNCQSGKFHCFDSQCVDNCTGLACECMADITCQNCANITSDCSCSCADGWTGGSCSAPCADPDSRCNNGWYSNWCDRSYVLNGCPKMCNACKERSSSTPACIVAETSQSNSKGTMATHSLTLVTLSFGFFTVLF